MMIMKMKSSDNNSNKHTFWVVHNEVFKGLNVCLLVILLLFCLLCNSDSMIYESPKRQDDRVHVTYIFSFCFLANITM